MDNVKQWNRFPLICLNILLKKIIGKCKKIIEKFRTPSLEIIIIRGLTSANFVK